MNLNFFGRGFISRGETSHIILRARYKGVRSVFQGVRGADGRQLVSSNIDIFRESLGKNTTHISRVYIKQY